MKNHFIGGFEVELNRKRIKNLNIRIKPPDGRIVVNAPLNMADSQIESYILKKSKWISEKSAEIRNSVQSRAYFASDEEKEEWKAAVMAVAPALIEEYERILGVKAGKIVYRNMSSRWGSCQPTTGRICLNTRLALYPPRCLEYVVAHELCHLKVRGHGKRFYRLLDKTMPDWKCWRDELNY